MSVDIYNQLGERLEAAFTAFRRQHELMHPVPDKPVNQIRRDRLMRFVLLAGLIGAVIVSASHTVVIFGLHKHPAIGVAAFLMLDAMIIAFGYYITREKYRNRQAEDLHVMRYMGRGIAVAFIVTVFANIQDVFTSAGFGVQTFGILWTVTLFVIELGKALSAPTMALITGHVYAMLNVQDAASDRRAEQEYEQRLKDWNDELLRSWQASKTKWGAAVNVSVEPVGRTADTDTRLSGFLSVRTDADGQRTDSGHGYARSSNAKEIVRQWLSEHPEDITAQVRELAARLNVGKSTVSDVQREFKADS